MKLFKEFNNIKLRFRFTCVYMDTYFIARFWVWMVFRLAYMLIRHNKIHKYVSSERLFVFFVAQMTDHIRTKHFLNSLHLLQRRGIKLRQKFQDKSIDAFYSVKHIHNN